MKGPLFSLTVRVFMRGCKVRVSFRHEIVLDLLKFYFESMFIN